MAVLQRVIVGVVAGLLVCGCGSEVDAVHPQPAGVAPSVARPAADRLVKSLVFDGGEFNAVPAPLSASPVISQARATALGRAADPNLHEGVAGTSAARTLTFYVKYAEVTVARSAFSHRLAWIVVSNVSSVSACPSERAPFPSRPPGYTTDFHVTVIDAQTGTSAVEYEQAALSLCSGKLHPPVVSVPVLSVSLPWTDGGPVTGGERIDYVLPACDTLLGTGGTGSARGDTVAVEAAAPFGHSARCRPARKENFVTTQATSYFHAPTGLEDEPNRYGR